MVSFPNAKINLGLRVLNKRPDGFHDIESCFLPVNWTDILEIIESTEEKFTYSGYSIPGPERDNLCRKAYELIKKDYSLPPIQLHLHKIIPVGGGTGGGSSDAAFTIKTLNNLFSLNLKQDKMEAYASRIGSDCKFFIQNKTAIATGTGTELKSFHLESEGKKVVLINSRIHISTEDAYKNIKTGPGKPGEIESILSQPVDQWKGALKNDFEEYVFSQHPELGDLKDLLYSSGAIFASLTGSGSTVYGIFDRIPAQLSIPGSYITWYGELN